jgi:hypothetical protein
VKSKAAAPGESALGRHHLNTDLLLEGLLLVMIWQTPTWLDTDEGMKIAPDCKERRFSQIHLNLTICGVIVQADDGFIPIQWLDQKRVGKLKRPKGHRATG